MSKNFTSREAKYSSYRKAIEQSAALEAEKDVQQFEHPTNLENPKSKLKTTTSLNAETILREIEKREEPNNQAMHDFEREEKMMAINKIITIALISVAVVVVLFVIFYFLYRSLS